MSRLLIAMAQLCFCWEYRWEDDKRESNSENPRKDLRVRFSLVTESQKFQYYRGMRTGNFSTTVAYVPAGCADGSIIHSPGRFSHLESAKPVYYGSLVLAEPWNLERSEAYGRTQSIKTDSDTSFYNWSKNILQHHRLSSLLILKDSLVCLLRSA
jgi:hypothetical protein